MRTLDRRVCVGLLATLLCQPLLAQRMVGGGLNYAPQPAVYEVLAVDADEHTVQLRAHDGRTGSVLVDEDIFDLHTVKAGDRLRVDFYVPDDANKGLRAAAVWPEQ